jgi:hypothetical protein
VTARGLETSLIPYGDRAYSIEFDFIRHRLQIFTAEGASRSIRLGPMSVASFYRKLMQRLEELDIMVHIWPMPVEIPGPVKPFSENTGRAAYDPEAVTRFWRVLLQIHRVFTEFRARFVGKVSPVHFFWGAFDLAVTRFSGRTAPKHPGGAPNCADWVMEEAYSHEVSSAGFWPGAGLGEARSIHMRTLSRKVSASTLYGPKRLTTMRIFGSSCYPTKPSGLPAIPAPCCSNFFRALTKQPLNWQGGSVINYSIPSRM